MWSGNLKTAVASLRLSRWRTVFTMLGIIIGISSVVTIVSLGEGLKQQISGQVYRLGSNVVSVRPGRVGKGGLNTLNLGTFLAPSTLTTSDVNTVTSEPSVDSASPIEFVTDAATSSSGELDNIFVAGSNASLLGIVNQKIAYGGYFTDEDSSQNFAVIGSDIADKMFGMLNPVGSTITINGQDFVVHGVLDQSGSNLLSIFQADINSSVFIPSGAAEDLTKGHTNILQILVRLKPGSNIDASVGSITRAIAKNHSGTTDFTVLKQSQLVDVSNRLVNTASSFVSGIAAISLLVGGIGIMNIMLVSVSERTREIGIRKAVGATNRQVLNQFLTEGLVLSIGGGAIGIAVSYLINLLLRLYTSWKPVISIPVLILAAGVSVAAGLIFSIAPALKAARKDPIAALRGE